MTDWYDRVLITLHATEGNTEIDVRVKDIVSYTDNTICYAIGGAPFNINCAESAAIIRILIREATAH